MLLDETPKAAERVLAFRDVEGDVSAAFVLSIANAVDAGDFRIPSRARDRSA